MILTMRLKFKVVVDLSDLFDKFKCHLNTVDLIKYVNARAAEIIILQVYFCTQISNKHLAWEKIQKTYKFNFGNKLYSDISGVETF